MSFLYLLHALLEERIPPGLADDQICPLHDHNAAEEGRVAGELNNLPLLVGLQETNTCFTGRFARASRVSQRRAEGMSFHSLPIAARSCPPARCSCGRPS